MKVGAHGKTHTDKDKLTHTIDFSITYDVNVYQSSGTTGAFAIKEEEGKIIVQHKYKEHSRSNIQDDPGLDFHRFSDVFKSMQAAVKMKPE